MSLGGKIMELFGSPAAVQPNPGSPVQQQQAAVTNNPQNNTLVPGGENKSDGSVIAIPKAAEGDKSPMAEFGKLWDKTDKTKDLVSPVPTFNIDVAKQLENAKKVDFVQHVNKEALEKASKGDASALAQVLNEAAQAGFGLASTSSATLLQEALKQQADTFRDEYMPEVLRRNEVSQQLRADNKVFDDPAVKPMFSMLETQFAKQYPTAAPAEIKDHVTRYLAGMSKLIATAAPAEVAAEARPSVVKSKAGDDWTGFFN